MQRSSVEAHVTPERPPGPYVGLTNYGVADADRFFGRADEIRELRELVLAHQFVVVHGPPAIGKTSLVRAGMIGTLEERAAHVLLVVSPRVSTAGWGAPGVHLRWSGGTSAPGVTDVGGDLPSSPRHVLRRLVARARGQCRERPLMLVVDSVDRAVDDEGSWSTHPAPFLDQLVDEALSVEELRLVLVTRDAALERMAPYEARVPASHRARYAVRELAPQAAVEAIVAPLRATGRSFVPGVAESLVDRLRALTPGRAAVEPTALQVVCTALWRALPDTATSVTGEEVRESGDLGAIFTHFCAWVVTDAAAAEDLPERAVRAWLARTVDVLDDGTGGSAVEAELDLSPGERWRLVRALEDRRLIRTEDRPGGVACSLLHEGLVAPVRALARGGAEAGQSPEVVLRAAEMALADGAFPLAAQLVRWVTESDDQRSGTVATAMALLGRISAARSRTQSGESAEESLAAAEDHYYRAAQLFGVEQDTRSVGRVLGSLGRLHLERGELVEAASVLQGAVVRLPGDTETRGDLVETLTRLRVPA